MSIFEESAAKLYPPVQTQPAAVSATVPVAQPDPASSVRGTTAGQGQETVAGSGHLPLIGSDTLSVGGSAGRVADHTVSLASEGILVDGSTQAFAAQTQAGALPAAIVSGQTISLASNGVVVDGRIQGSPVIPTQAPSIAVITLGSQVVEATQGSNIVVGSRTLSVGGRAVTTAGETVSLASQGVVINGITKSFSAASSTLASTPGAVFQIGSQTYTALGSSGIITFGSVTLTPGQVATVSGTVVSDASTGVVVGSSTYALSLITPAPIVTGAILTDGLATLTAVSEPNGVVVIDGTTLSPGGPAFEINSQLISDASSVLVVSGTETISFSIITNAAQQQQQSVDTVFTIGGLTYTASSVAGKNGVVVIDGSTLSIGGPAATISGQFVSEGSSGIVVGGRMTAAFSTIAGPSRTSHTTISGAGAVRAIAPWGLFVRCAPVVVYLFWNSVA